jgi:hypothetical protein
MPIRINLLGEAQAAEELRRRDPAKRAVWIGVFLIFLVLLWSSSLWVKMLTENMRLGSLESQLNLRTNQYNQVLNNERKLGEINAKLAALNQLATNRFLAAPVLDALQHSVVDGIQLMQLNVQQNFIVIPDTPPMTTERGVKIAGRPGNTTEKNTLLLSAKDSSANPGAEQLNLYIETLARSPYFLEQHISTNNITLKGLLPPEVDSDTGKSFVKFTLECSYPDRVR